MAKKRVIKPGIWWIVRFRRFESFEQITGFMTCSNAYRAGHSGFDRKRRPGRVNHPRTVRRYVRRNWDLKDYSYRRLAYRFAEIADLRTSVRCGLVATWMQKWNGIMEVVEVEGCLFYGTITSEKVIERKFHTTNEMEILALEYGMGE